MNKKVLKAHICALSYGCYISTIFAQMHPEKVLSICHIGGHYNNPSRLYNVFQNFWEKRGDEYSKWLSQYANTIFPSGILKANPFAVISRNIYYRFGLQLHSSIIAQSLRHRLEFDLKSKLKSLPHPILWVMGEHDHLYKSCLFDLKSILPNVLYKEIPLAGHARTYFVLTISMTYMIDFKWKVKIKTIKLPIYSTIKGFPSFLGKPFLYEKYIKLLFLSMLLCNLIGACSSKSYLQN